MALEIHQFLYGSDNYGVLVHDADSGETACVDAGDAAAVFDALGQTGWTLSQVWITHHHGDHVAGLEEVKARTGARVIGPGYGRDSAIPGVDQRVREGDEFDFAGHRVAILHTPGHTLDMINFHLPDDGIVFSGDTLFVAGCGRLFEGDAEMMWASLQKLAALPPETVVYCSHEYTAANMRFALSVDGGNAALRAKAAEVDRLRSEARPTVPTVIAEELATNPFLRAGDAAIRRDLGLERATDAEVFAELRRRKDRA